jgi:alkanesulfonate monooxygenase SsuD/methylene tetrahydromethanopterin reductase-like flavin-dependent oxidoreductase (luciferase family)
MYAGVDPNKAKAMFEESLETIVAGLTHDTLTHDGEFHHYRGVPMQMRPLQKPHPPFWYPTHAPESVAAVAARGMNVITVGPDRRIRELADVYHEQWQKHRTDPDRLNTQVATPFFGVTKQVFIADSDSEAERIARPAYEAWRLNNYSALPPCVRQQSSAYAGRYVRRLRLGDRRRGRTAGGVTTVGWGTAPTDRGDQRRQLSDVLVPLGNPDSWRGVPVAGIVRYRDYAEGETGRPLKWVSGRLRERSPDHGL